MSFSEQIKERAKADIKTICLPEATDKRVLKATEQIIKEGYAKIVLVGNREKIEELVKREQIEIEGATIVDPSNSPKYEEYVNLLFNLRKEK